MTFMAGQCANPPMGRLASRSYMGRRGPAAWLGPQSNIGGIKAVLLLKLEQTYIARQKEKLSKRVYTHDPW